jgi:hypothetical protein
MPEAFFVRLSKKGINTPNIKEYSKLAFPLGYSPLNGEMSALTLTEGSVCASKRWQPQG